MILPWLTFHNPCNTRRKLDLPDRLFPKINRLFPASIFKVKSSKENKWKLVNLPQKQFYHHCSNLRVYSVTTINQARFMMRTSLKWANTVTINLFKQTNTSAKHFHYSQRLRDQLGCNGYIKSWGKFGQKTQYQRTGTKESLYQFTGRETGNSAETIEELHCCAKH